MGATPQGDRLHALARERERFQWAVLGFSGTALALLGPIFAATGWSTQATWHNAMLLALTPIGAAIVWAGRRGRPNVAIGLLAFGALAVAGGVHLSGHGADMALLYLMPVLVVGWIAGDSLTVVVLPAFLVAGAAVIRALRWDLGVDDDWSLWWNHSTDALAVLALTGVLTWLGRRRMARNESVLQQVLWDRQRLADKARAASDEKSAFLARVSHELRTPLNAILGYSELIEEEEELSDDAAGDLDKVQQAARQLLALVDDVLDLSKVEAGRWEPSLVELTLEELLEPVRVVVAPLVARNRSELRVSWSGEPVTLDAARVRQVLVNLLSNAARFTEGGVVTLRAQRSGTMMSFEVEDTGIGIPADRLSSLFEPFVQATAETAAQYGGTGLGLAICDRFVRQMGGHMEVHSEVGKGSVFRVVLPVVSATPPPS